MYTFESVLTIILGSLETIPLNERSTLPLDRSITFVKDSTSFSNFTSYQVKQEADRSKLLVINESPGFQSKGDEIRDNPFGPKLENSLTKEAVSSYTQFMSLYAFMQIYGRGLDLISSYINALWIEVVNKEDGH